VPIPKRVERTEQSSLSRVDVQTRTGVSTRKAASGQFVPILDLAIGYANLNEVAVVTSWLMEEGRGGA
jgi:hypothetical protein